MDRNFAPLLIFVILVLELLAFTSILPLFPALIEYYGLDERKDKVYDAIEMFCHFFESAVGIPSSKHLHSVWATANSFTFFVLSRAVGGLSKASVSICIAIMADVYSRSKIGQGMAIIGAAFSIGFLIGPTIGVYFSRIAVDVGTEMVVDAPAKFAISLTVIELAFVILLLPETLASTQRKTLFDEVLKNCLLYIKPSALFQFSAIGNRSGLEFTLSFLTHTRFNYNSKQQGIMYLYIGALMIVVQGLIRLIPNNKQHLTAIYGISLTTPAYIIIGCSSGAGGFFAGLALYAIGFKVGASSVVVPCMTSCITNQATDDVKGVTIGVFRCLGALARAFGPLFASTVFWLLGPTVCYISGGVFLIIPVLMLRYFPSSTNAIKED
ncbi:unnamed protein product [Litomosoides sigmodontis]|uniref:Major facilitator superfamily (MFS) profile domain-containing protein n=1 Tax=Litomosoides sigmodontis TaxID=42156 RepID=A0A3P6TFC7_LITSI|nr:unnamed protein product [Litomosoides sigmodontis]